TAAGVSIPAKNPDGYTDITVDELAAMMPVKDFQLINVHVPDQGDLPGTDAAIPFDEIGTRANELPAKDAPIVLYCRSGNMSTQAAKTLVDMGYTNIMELDGGFNAWRDSGRQMAGAVTP
ncbi:MAG: rhodanese-like domain-containing protein, partial [Anaerolineae bacterium]